MTGQVLPTAKRSVGRPPRLTLDKVIDAACEIGLDAVDMATVAARLSIGVGTLYGYVNNREHLISLAARRIATRGGIADTGQSWEDALREHARRSYVVYRETRQLITQMMDGLLGDLADSTHTDALLRIMVDRGLSPQMALRLFLETNQIVIGAAVGATYVQTLMDEAGGKRELEQATIAKCQAEGLDTLELTLAGADLLAMASDYRPGLERLIAMCHDEMGQ